MALKLRWFTIGAQANSSYNICEAIGTWYSWEKRATQRGALDTLHDRTVISNDHEFVGRDQIVRHQTRLLVLERSIPRNLHHVKKDSYKGYCADFIVQDTSVHYLPDIVAITLHKILLVYLRKYKTKIQMYIKWTRCNSRYLTNIQNVSLRHIIKGKIIIYEELIIYCHYSYNIIDANITINFEIFFIKL